MKGACDRPAAWKSRQTPRSVPQVGGQHLNEADEPEGGQGKIGPAQAKQGIAHHGGKDGGQQQGRPKERHDQVEPWLSRMAVV